MMSAFLSRVSFFPRIVVNVSVFSNCFRGPEKNCLWYKSAYEFLSQVRYSLEDLIPELIFIKQISEVAEVKVLDVSTVRKKCGIECRSDNGSPQYGPTLDSE
jgi:hypothetical protein